MDPVTTNRMPRGPILTRRERGRRREGAGPTRSAVLEDYFSLSAEEVRQLMVESGLFKPRYLAIYKWDNEIVDFAKGAVRRIRVRSDPDKMKPGDNIQDVTFVDAGPAWWIRRGVGPVVRCAPEGLGEEAARGYRPTPRWIPPTPGWLRRSGFWSVLMHAPRAPTRNLRPSQPRIRGFRDQHRRNWRSRRN